VDESGSALVRRGCSCYQTTRQVAQADAQRRNEPVPVSSIKAPASRPMLSAILLCLVLVSRLLAQHPQSLVTSARQLGGKADNGLTVELTFVPFDTLVADADVIVRGRVRSVSTRLSTDERWVLTQYEVTPTHFFKRPSSDKSGPIGDGSVFVTHPGGQVQVDGLQLATNVNVYPQAEILRQGEDVILLLSKKESEPGTFQIEGGPFGAFRVKRGMVAYMTQAVRDNHPDEALTGFDGRMSEALAKR
jgi:hypothetical protein